jgi:hypothetical protein
MSAIRSEAERQLSDEITDRLWRLHVLGIAAADPHDPVAASQIRAIAGMLVAQLAQDDDDRLAAQTAIDVMAALWPHGDPEQIGQPTWWRTPLGRLIGRSIGSDDEAVSLSVAAAMLGVSRSAVSHLLARGQLDRHPDGGVVRSSILQRLERRGLRVTGWDPRCGA